ncbi:hypothetical protein ASD81_11825 [Nocardioides sp. Root614]|nr:hypothetical protein ASD81_11825 [Nocardioides sp. Root614]KRA93162.1 hypothetical protein ASD84_12090 [Nocardioides sp. Root682]
MTLAHPAAVLPLRGLGLPLSAMVIGSMAPDLPVFSQSWETYGFTHSLAGLVTVDLAITLLLLGFWDRWGRDALVDTAPSRVRDRLPARVRIGRTAWLLAPLAAVLGSATHVLWDAFTHAGRWGVQAVPWLHETHAGMHGSQWAQFGSGILGLLVVGAAILAVVQGPVLPDAPRPRRLPGVVLPAAIAAASVVSVGTFLAQLDTGAHTAAFFAAVVGIVGLALAVAGVTATWTLAVPVSDPDAPAGPPAPSSTTPASP